MYTLSQATEAVWKDLGKKYEPMYNSNNLPEDNVIKNWRAVITKVFTPLLDRMEQVFLTSKQTIKCDATGPALHEFVVFAETTKFLESTWPVYEIGDKQESSNVPKSYPTQLSRLLCTELGVLHVREKPLDNGFYGLVWGGSPPDCNEMNSTVIAGCSR